MAKPHSSHSRHSPRTGSITGWLVFLLSILTRSVKAATETNQLTTVMSTLLIPILLAAFILLIFVIWSYRKERRRARLRQLAERKRRKVTQQVQKLFQSKAAAASSPPSPMLAVVSDMVESSSKLPVPAISPLSPKVCTKCNREYRTALSRCPLDNGALVEKSSSTGNTFRDDYLDTQRSIMVCESCNRQYDLGAKYCLYDGKKLVTQEDEDEHVLYDGAMVCSECGEEFDENSYFCPDDGSRLLPAEPDAQNASYGAIPIAFCTQCLTEHPISTTVCPHDEQPLVLMMGRTTGALPVHGVGRRSKICGTCGERFSGDASFCALDGSRLLAMN